MLFGNVTKIILIVLLTLISAAICGKCYQCRSDKDSDCGELKGKGYLIDCDETVTDPPISPNAPVEEFVYTANGPQICRKLVQKLKPKKSAKYVTIRECAQKYIGKKCHKISNKLVYMNICDCRGDGCNGCTRVVFNLILLLLSLIAIIITHHLYS